MPSLLWRYRRPIAKDTKDRLSSKIITRAAGRLAAADLRKSLMANTKAK
jgi:hypothetical protein